MRTPKKVWLLRSNDGFFLCENRSGEMFVHSDALMAKLYDRDPVKHYMAGHVFTSVQAELVVNDVPPAIYIT